MTKLTAEIKLLQEQIKELTLQIRSRKPMSISDIKDSDVKVKK
jgi:hypothetical protein